MHLQAPLPDVYRGKYRDPETAGQLYAEEVKELIDQAHSKGRKVLIVFLHHTWKMHYVHVHVV